jgi:hypothetical protein
MKTSYKCHCEDASPKQSPRHREIAALAWWLARNDILAKGA